MSDEKTGWSWKEVSLLAVGIAALAVGGMYLWGVYVVEPMAQRAQSFSAPGAYGDSFAPFVAALTAFTLGAAIASVLMQRSELQLQREEMKLQREEMKDAREQYEAQANALLDANRLARCANELARSAQVIEISRQLSVIDDYAGKVWNELHQVENGRAQWDAYVDDKDRGGTAYERFITGTLPALYLRRTILQVQSRSVYEILPDNA